MGKIVDMISLLVGITLLSLGFFLIFTDAYSNIPQNYKLIFGSLLITYGGVRTVMVILKIRDRINMSDNEE